MIVYLMGLLFLAVLAVQDIKEKKVITKENIGYGDGLTVIVLGLWTGIWFTFYVLCVGLMLSGFCAAVYLIKKKRETIPLIPFLLIGMEVVLIYA